MSKEDLLERKTRVEQQFSEYDVEMKRLQGEHRLLVDLLALTEEQETVEVKHKPAKRRIRKVEHATN